MKLMDKRGSELVSNKLIILILVVLVVLVIIVFTMRSDTLNWIKNLPGFKAPVDSEIDLTTLSPSELTNMGYTCEGKDDVKVGIIGPKATGNFVYQMAYDVRYLYMFDFTTAQKLERVKLQVNVNDMNAKTIDVIEGLNVNVGNIIGRSVLINRVMYDKNSKDTQKVLKYITEAQLRRLGGSYTVGGSLICKNKIEIAKEARAIPVYFYGYEFVKQDNLIWLYKDGQQTKFYREGNYLKYTLSWGENKFGFGHDPAIFSVDDSTGRILYLDRGAEMFEQIKSNGDEELLEKLRESKIAGNKLLSDESMSNWVIVGKIDPSAGQIFFIDKDGESTPLKLSYAQPGVGSDLSFGGLKVDISTWSLMSDFAPLLIVPDNSKASKVTEEHPIFDTFHIAEYSKDIGKLVLNPKIDTLNKYNIMKKDYPNLPDYSVLQELVGANYEFGKLVIYKIKTSPLPVANENKK